MKIINRNHLERFRKNINNYKNKSGTSGLNNSKPSATRAMIVNTRILSDSLTKLDPRYLAKNNPVMFAVEVGFIVVLIIGLFPNISSEFVNGSQIFYLEIAIILILTVWFATFSESLSEAQARARVDSLRSLEKEVSAHKLINGNGGGGRVRKEVTVKSTTLNPGDEVMVYAGEIIPRDGLVNEGKAFVDESMMTGESNPVYKERGDHVIGGTKVASDKLVVEITSEAGRSFLDQMVGLIQNATRPKTKNEIALTILLAGLSLIFIIVIGTLLFFAYFLGYTVDIATLIALLVALMPTTIGGLLPAIGVSGITRLGRDSIVAKSGKGIEAAGDCDVLILDKTGTITEGSRSAIKFIPMEGYSEEDVGQAAFAASIHDTSHEGKSIVDLAEEKKYTPSFMEKIITSQKIDFSAETKFSGIEFIADKRRPTPLTKEQKEELESYTTASDSNENQKTTENNRVHKILLELEQNNRQVKILKGAVDTMLKIAHGHVNEAELKWKVQEVSGNGETPLVVTINNVVIGLVSLKDNLKEDIRQKLDEVRATGITTVMITGDNQLTAQVIANEANVDQVMAEAKPTDKLKRVEEEQLKGHVIGMVGDGTNDAPALAKADIGLAMNSGTAAG